MNAQLRNSTRIATASTERRRVASVIAAAALVAAMAALAGRCEAVRPAPTIALAVVGLAAVPVDGHDVGGGRTKIVRGAAAGAPVTVAASGVPPVAAATACTGL